MRQSFTSMQRTVAVGLNPTNLSPICAVAMLFLSEPKTQDVVETKLSSGTLNTVVMGLFTRKLTDMIPDNAVAKRFMTAEVIKCVVEES